jgi:hypothetical protein
MCGMMSGIIRRRRLRGWSGSKEMGGIEIRDEAKEDSRMNG